MKNGIKTLAMWLIIGVIFIVVLSSIIENSDSKLKYSELISNINSGNVEDIEIQSDGTSAIVTLKDEQLKREVNIPDMIGWNIDDVVEVIKKNKMDHVTIDYEFRDDITRDEEFEQNKSGNMKRSDELKLKFSLTSI